MLKRLKLYPQDLLLVLLLFHLFGNIIWIKFNNSPPAWDEAYNTMRSLDYLHIFENFLLGRFDLNGFTNVFIDYYGPLVRFITGFVLLIFNPQVKLAQFIATPFFLGTIYLTYLLADRLYKNQWVGLFAAFLFSFFQVIYNDSRWLLLDIPMTFFTLLSLYFFVQSDFFASRKYSALSFIACVLAILTKFQGMLYLFLPYLWGLFMVIKGKQYRRFWNIAIGGVILLAPITFYIIPSIEKIKLYYGLAVPGEPLVDPIYLMNPTTWFHHLKLFINYEITFPIFVFFVISLYFYIRYDTLRVRESISALPEGVKTKWFLLLNVVFYYFFFTVFPNKDMRFLFPVLPYIAILFAQGFSFFWKKYKNAATEALLFIILFNVVMYFILSFELFAKKGKVYFLDIPYFTDLAVFNMKNYPVLTYDPYNYPQEQIIKDLRALSLGKQIEVVLIPNFEWFNDNNLGIYDRIYRTYNINTLRSGGRTRFESREELESYMSEYYYFLTTPGEVGVFYQTDLEAFRQMQELVNEWLANGEAQILKKYPLSEQEIWLVKRISTM